MWALEGSADKSRVAEAHQFQARAADELMRTRPAVGAIAYGFRVVVEVVGHR
jgi:hypothetical protein